MMRPYALGRNRRARRASVGGLLPQHAIRGFLRNGTDVQSLDQIAHRAHRSCNTGNTRLTASSLLSWPIGMETFRPPARYRGDYSFEVFNDDYQQMPLETVARRARRSALWLGESVWRRSVPLPNQIRLKG